MTQLPLDPITALIERRCAEEKAAIHHLAEIAHKFINRSCGQHLRYWRVRFGK